MKYAKLEITTELSFLEEFFKGIDNEISIISIDIDNKDDYTAEQLQMICQVFDDQWHRLAKEFACELGESWTEYIKSYYGY